MAEKEITIEDKLKALYELQKVRTQIKKIRDIRGELPLEVHDLEDEIAGLKTRIQNIDDDMTRLRSEISKSEAAIKEAESKIAKYKEQQDNVRNSREYDSLIKEVEFQTLEIELQNKHIREYNNAIENKKTEREKAVVTLQEKESDCRVKKTELNDIVAETREQEALLREQGKLLEENIKDDRLLAAFNRIRNNARNGLAVVPVERDSCGGCFNKIPAQRQLDIRLRKKIIVCEYCGRILIDAELAGIQKD
jgi:hypothetical protein